MTLRQRIGALLYDAPGFAARMLSGRWVFIRNRNERLTTDGRGARCEWQFTSDLHIARVYPFTGRWLMRKALRDWPMGAGDGMTAADAPVVSFVVGHRGRDRLPLLQRTLRSIAAQHDASIECIVVEQSVSREVETQMPPWVRYVHTPSDAPYSRAWAFNVGARLARGRLLVLHDNDMLVPERYAAEAMARAGEGWSFLDLKRFIFYLDAEDRLETVVQNAQGGSVIATREAYFAIGGFDESFIGWGAEDNDFRERAEEHGRVYGFGYLPIVHLYHPPQKGKLEGADAPAVRRYRELANVPPRERIARLRERDMGRLDGPSM